jgi:hypothetical protein
MPKAKKSDSAKPEKEKGKRGKGEKPAKEGKGGLKNKIKSVLRRKPKTKSAPGASKPTAITPDDIALRAYFIAERRQAMGWIGDETSDWVEAEKQLKAEVKKRI